MDKGRHPQVVRTWRVERTKVPNRVPQPKKAQPQIAPSRKPQTERAR